MNNEPSKELRIKLINEFNSRKYSDVIKNIINLQKKFSKSIFLFNLLGASYNEMANHNEAIKCFNKIIDINPNFADAYYNLAVINKKLDQQEDAESNYIKSIRINPKKFEAYNNLGNIYKDKKNTKLAIKNYLKSLEINPNYTIALQNFGICLQSFKFTKVSKDVEKIIIKLLNQNKILRPVDIIDSLIHYLYLNPRFTKFIKNIDIIEKKYNLDNLVKEILNFEILISLLAITPITDLKIEKFLQYLRFKILSNISSVKNKSNTLKLMKAIAKQCFINEYIYPVKKDEENKLKEIENRILVNSEKNIEKKSSLEIACLAAYKPLNLYSWADKIINLNDISDLVKQQISEPKIELEYKKTFKSKDIKNSISLEVKNQYEKNPYPRWIKVALNNNPKNPIDYFNNLNLDFYSNKIKNWDYIDVLVAGCGTGQHAITTATKYNNSQVTAIDLSSNSLSYAKRKAEELEIKNIEFIQLDILDLINFKKKFEIIECIGVLHHMEDPYRGWINLYKILKTDGLMSIGLYSMIAREHIKRIRNNIKKLNFKKNEKNIKNYREQIIFSNNKDEILIKESSDFYSLSNLTDLLFHVQEHQFNIPQIKNFLVKHNLKFSGFENREILNLFKEKYTNKKDLYDLGLWNDFEKKNRRIFAGMYQFWCQKLK